MKLIKRINVVLLFTLILCSCASKKDKIYFQNIKDQQDIVNQTSITTQLLKPNDVLKVSVLAFDMSAVAVFNGQGLDSEGAGGASKKYLIDIDGFIEFPLLGKIKLAGKSLNEATKILTARIAEYVKDPIVDLELDNFKITVLGEVARPGVFKIDNERVTILEALGLAGDMTIHGQRKNVLVISENDGKKSYNRIDLTSDEVFKSPVYYLSQNDVVYVEPSKTKINESSVRSTGLILSTVGVLLSITTLIINNTK